MSKYILFSLLFWNTVAWSQDGAIKGRVTDGQHGLAFAHITSDGGLIGATSDLEGIFNVENVSPGTYQLEASYVGYDAIVHELKVEAGKATEVHFVLHASAPLEEIVVTGTLKPRYVSTSPVKVDVITAKQLETYMPAAASSIVESVQLVNGVQEVIACGVCYTNNISINGLNGAYTSVLMDGTPIYGNLASVYGLNGIPNMIIDRFEIIKGPSSTLYGSEAVAGVINIITKDPKEQPLLSIDIMGTTHRESFGNVAIAPVIGKTNGYVGINYAVINDFDDANEDGFGDAINLDRYSLFTKWNIHRKSGLKFNLAGKLYYEDRRNGVEEYLSNRNYRRIRGSDHIYGESIYTKRGELFGTYALTQHDRVKVDFSLSHHDQDSYYGSDFYKASQSIAFGNFIWNIQKKKHDVIIGATARYNSYDDNTVATEKWIENQKENNPDNQFIPGIFVQDEIAMASNLILLAGGRFDHFSNHGLVFSPRLNIKYNPGDWTTVRANFGTGFRNVNLFTEDHAFVTGQRTVVIEESLLPEKSVNGSFSINNVYAAFGGSGNVEIEGYYTHFSNKILPDYDTPGQIIYANSNGHARTLGMGININHTFAFPLAFNAGVNLQSATETEYDENNQSITRDIEYAPKWTGTLTANYQWKKQSITFAYTAQLTGPMALPKVYDLDENGIRKTNPRPTLSEPFGLHNLQVSKMFSPIFSLYGGIQNLTNYRQNSSPLSGYNDPNTSIGFSEFFDTSYAYAPNHGREFYLGIKWSLEGRKSQ